MNHPAFKLNRDLQGRLMLSNEYQQIEHLVIAIRAFPISAADEEIALVDRQGNELLWIENLQDIPVEWQELIEEEFASRDFMPEIKHIDSVAIRRLSSTALLITDQYGVHFLIRDRTKLDRQSAKLLDRFL